MIEAISMGLYIYIPVMALGLLAALNFVARTPVYIGIISAALLAIASGYVILAANDGAGDKDRGIFLQFGLMLFLFTLSIGLARTFGQRSQSWSTKLAMMIVGPGLPIAFFVAAQVDTLFW